MRQTDRPKLEVTDDDRPAERSWPRRISSNPALFAFLTLGCVFLASAGPAPLVPVARAGVVAQTATTTGTEAGNSLEVAARKAGDMGRKVAMSLIALALAAAGVILAFRRDFRKVAGVLVIGLLAVLLATPAGVSVLQNTVTALFGSA